MSTYSEVQALWTAAPASIAPLPPSSLPTVALVTLLGAFGLTFWFTTLPPKLKSLPLEIISASGASILAGFGVVALFCTVGVYV